MKNMNNILGLLRTSALCLTLAVMAACDAEDFTRTAGDIPGKDDLANVGGVPVSYTHLTRSYRLISFPAAMIFRS